MRLLVADDEYLAVDAIKTMIAKHFPEAEVVGTASSGKEAIMKVTELNPDVALMDIHMPGIDGIEAIRQIRQSHPHMLFIILTAYDFFDYAKEAIGLGVVDYLLKPIKRESFVHALSLAHDRVVGKKEAQQMNFEVKEKLNMMRPFLENQFIMHHLYAYDSAYNQKDYEDLFETSLNYGFAVTLMALDQDRGDYKSAMSRYDFFEKAKIVFRKAGVCIIGQPIDRKLSVWFPLEDFQNFESSTLEKIQKVRQRLLRQGDFNFKIGVGQIIRYDHLIKSFRESEKALEASGDVVFFENEFINTKANPSSFDEGVFGELAAHVGRLEFMGAKKSFMKLHETYVHLDLGQYRHMLLAALFVSEKQLPFEWPILSDQIRWGIFEKTSIRGLSELFLQAVDEWEAYAKQRLSQVEGGVIPEALVYIEAHYNENINMDDVAKNVNVSYHYFSKLFKQQTGKSFTDYLTDLRIEKSLEMLRMTQRSIKEISLEIGYNDPNYYCKIFKKITGVTPTEYRVSNEKRSL